MKEKEEKKRNEDLAKRVVGNVLKSQSDRILIPDPNVYDQKDALIKKLETQDYNPFGKAGGGAPNRRQINQVPNTMEQNRSVLQGYSCIHIFTQLKKLYPTKTFLLKLITNLLNITEIMIKEISLRSLPLIETNRLHCKDNIKVYKKQDIKIQEVDIRSSQP